MAILCTLPTGHIADVEAVSGGDLTSVLTVRYKLEAEPDSSYVNVSTVKEVMGLTIPTFDPATVDPGTYVVHTFVTADGDSTGFKFLIEVGCEDAPLP